MIKHIAIRISPRPLSIRPRVPDRRDAPIYHYSILAPQYLPSRIFRTPNTIICQRKQTLDLILSAQSSLGIISSHVSVRACLVVLVTAKSDSYSLENRLIEVSGGYRNQSEDENFVKIADLCLKAPGLIGPFDPLSPLQSLRYILWHVRTSGELSNVIFGTGL